MNTGGSHVKPRMRGRCRNLWWFFGYEMAPSCGSCIGMLCLNNRGYMCLRQPSQRARAIASSGDTAKRSFTAETRILRLALHLLLFATVERFCAYNVLPRKFVACLVRTPRLSSDFRYLYLHAFIVDLGILCSRSHRLTSSGE